MCIDICSFGARGSWISYTENNLKYTKKKLPNNTTFLPLENSSLLRSKAAYIVTGHILPWKLLYVFLTIEVWLLRGRRSSGRLRKRSWDLYNFLTEIQNLCGSRLNWLEDIHLSYREMWKWRKLGGGEPAAMRATWAASPGDGQLLASSRSPQPVCALCFVIECRVKEVIFSNLSNKAVNMDSRVTDLRGSD